MRQEKGRTDTVAYIATALAVAAMQQTAFTFVADNLFVFEARILLNRFR